MTRIAITGLLFVMAALASVLVGNGHFTLADNVNNKNNAGINIPTDTDQKQVCKTTGENSPIIGGTVGSPTMGAGAWTACKPV